ncbi:CARM1 methyltransferase, partial [Polyodon spathula]|nr:CARM1 methyltransferase [Polyodon spathula]
MSQGMPGAYDLSGVIPSGSTVGHNNLIPLELWSVSLISLSRSLSLSLSLANTGIVNHTHSRMGSIMSTGIMQGNSSGQAGPSTSGGHYPINNQQFTMGGPAISMASPLSIPSNTMHYGS